MKITKEQLSKIHEIAKYHYRHDSNAELNPDQLVSQAWIKSTLDILFPELDIVFPKRIISESVFSD